MYMYSWFDFLAWGWSRAKGTALWRIRDLRLSMFRILFDQISTQKVSTRGWHQGTFQWNRTGSTPFFDNKFPVEPAATGGTPSRLRFNFTNTLYCGGLFLFVWWSLRIAATELFVEPSEFSFIGDELVECPMFCNTTVVEGIYIVAIRKEMKSMGYKDHWFPLISEIEDRTMKQSLADMRIN